MIVFLAQERIINMKQTVMNILNSFYQERSHPFCLNIGIREEWQSIHIRHFFHIKIASLSSR